MSKLIGTLCGVRFVSLFVLAAVVSITLIVYGYYIKHIDEQVVALERQVAAMEQLRMERQGMVASLERGGDALAARVAALEGMDAEMKGMMAPLGSRMTALETEMGATGGQLLTALLARVAGEKKLAALDARVARVESDTTGEEMRLAMETRVVESEMRTAEILAAVDTRLFDAEEAVGDLREYVILVHDDFFDAWEQNDDDLAGIYAELDDLYGDFKVMGESTLLLYDGLDAVEAVLALVPKVNDEGDLLLDGRVVLSNPLGEGKIEIGHTYDGGGIPYLSLHRKGVVLFIDGQGLRLSNLVDRTARCLYEDTWERCVDRKLME